jgi:mannose-1-phosphate guanylyltransferase
MKAIVLAAGLGTRMLPHSLVLPKPAFPFLNIPLIYYPIHLLERLDLRELVVNTHHLPEGLMPALRSFPEMNFKLHMSHETGAILGSGGGIGFAREQLRGDQNFCAFNGDELLFPSNGQALSRFRDLHLREDALATLFVMKHPKVGSQFGGVWADVKGHIQGFGKTPPTGTSGLTPYHFTGLQMLSDRIFDYIPEGESNIFYDVIAKALLAGEKIQIYEDRCVWYETGNPADFLEATQICLELMQQSHESPWLKELFMRFWPQFEMRPSLWEGQDCHHHLNDLGRLSVLLGDRVRIHGSADVRGFVVIGDDTVIGEDCVLQNCVIRSRLKIPAGTVIENNLCLSTDLKSSNV